MPSILNPDNAFFRITTKICYVCLLSLLWVACSIPIVTIGAATASVNAVMLLMVKDEEEYIVKSFFKAFKAHFKTATITWLAILAGMIVIGGDIFFFARLGNGLGVICAGLFSSVMILLMLTLMVIFHCLAWFRYSVKETFLVAFKIAMVFFPYSAALLILFMAMGYAVYVSVPLMMIFTFFGMGIFSYISAYLWRRNFEKIRKQSDRNSNE